MRRAFRALALGLMLSGCSDYPSDDGPAMASPSVLTPETPSAELALPAGAERGVLLVVSRVVNPALREARLGIYVPGERQPFQTVTLYPPDRPARVALTPPTAARRVVVRLERGAEPPPERIEIGVSPLDTAAARP